MKNTNSYFPFLPYRLNAAFDNSNRLGTYRKQFANHILLNNNNSKQRDSLNANKRVILIDL